MRIPTSLVAALLCAGAVPVAGQEAAVPGDSVAFRSGDVELRGGAVPVAGQEAAVPGDSVAFRSGDVELRGVLYLPEGPPPHAAVFFLHGGGRRWINAEPTDFARMALERGMAALVYDKRGTGASGGNWAAADFEDFIADGGAAYRYLAGRDDIDAGRIGVVGFSQGGRLAPVLAARYPVAVAVSVSGPAVSPAETRLYALENNMRENGLSEEAIGRSLDLWRRFFEALAAGRPLAPLDSAIYTAAQDIPPGALPPPSEHYQAIPHFNSLNFDPSADWARLDTPFLALFGELDVVVPVDPSVAALTAALAPEGRDDVVIRVLPGATHALDRPPGTRDPDYVPTVMDWLERWLGEE
jgi:pimeloyl-ACP methyl ester carboxylesterase